MDLMTGALLPLTVPYAVGGMVHRLARAFARPFELDVPVVLVGNLTVGGTGKTPLAWVVARRLARRGRRPAIVSRGYGGRRTVDPAVVSDGRRLRFGPGAAGDEAVLTARTLPGVPVVVGRDRVAAARLAVEETGAGSLVLDDGFQQRDRFPGALSVVAVNAAAPFGNGWLLPAGPLREPAANLADADVAVLTHAEAAAAAELARARGRVAALAPRALVVAAVHRLRAPRSLAGRRVLAMAAIGWPQGFVRALSVEARARVVGTVLARDHHRWAAAEAAEALRRAARLRCAAVVTTAKDAVRLPWPKAARVPLVAAGLDVELPAAAERRAFLGRLDRHADRGRRSR